MPFSLIFPGSKEEMGVRSNEKPWFVTIVVSLSKF
jgi:hypothetical protein